MRDWLDFLASVKGTAGLAAAPDLQRAAAAQLSDGDARLQLAALQCLKAFKLRRVSR